MERHANSNPLDRKIHGWTRPQCCPHRQREPRSPLDARGYGPPFGRGTKVLVPGRWKSGRGRRRPRRRCASQRVGIEPTRVVSMPGRKGRVGSAVLVPMGVDADSEKTGRKGKARRARRRRIRPGHVCRTSWTIEERDRKRRSGCQIIMDGWSSVHVEEERIDQQPTGNAVNRCTTSKRGLPTH